MSAQQNQRLRQNGSPSTKQGPIRATQQFALSSPSRNQVRCSPSSSPAPKENAKSRSRPLSETGLLTGRRSPSSPCGLRLVEKPKPITAGRSNSFDNVMAAPYLCGQWPKDGHWQQQKEVNTYCTSINNTTFTCEKQTQTPDELEEYSERRRPTSKTHKSRSQSVGSGDQQLKNIKHKLQRNGGLPSSGVSTYQQRLSPVFPLGSCLPPSSSMPMKIPLTTSSTSGGHITAPRGTPGKARGSVEGLNQEVEKLIISGRRGFEGAASDFSVTVDGHREPVSVFLNTRSIDTQTPVYSSNGGGDFSSETLPTMLEIRDSSSEGSRERSDSRSSDDLLSHSRGSSRGEEDEEGRSSQSVSPFIPDQFELEDSGLAELNCDLGRKMSPSPRPNSEFMRQPPDGAERIKITDELTFIPKNTEIRHIIPSRSFRPSESSAFKNIPLKRSMESRQTVENAH